MKGANHICWFQLWQQRISAGCRELGSSYEVLVRGMARCQIALDKKTLANLAIWEPRTFKVTHKLCKYYWSDNVFY
jgi:large subunit ribosomal protein L20